MTVSADSEREALRELFEGIPKASASISYGPLRLFKPDGIELADECWRVKCAETGEIETTINVRAFRDPAHLRAYLDAVISGDEPPWWNADSPYSGCSGQTTR